MLKICVFLISGRFRDSNHKHCYRATDPKIVRFFSWRKIATGSMRQARQECYILEKNQTVQTAFKFANWFTGFVWEVTVKEWVANTIWKLLLVKTLKMVSSWKFGTTRKIKFLRETKFGRPPEMKMIKFLREMKLDGLQIWSNFYGKRSLTDYNTTWIIEFLRETKPGSSPEMKVIELLRETKFRRPPEMSNILWNWW